MKKIIKNIITNAPINKVYDMWTTRDGLNTFFGEDSKIELKVNGAFEIYFNLSWPKGFRGSEGCKIVDFVKNKYISFTWNVPPTFEEARARGYHSIVKIEFIELDESKTEILVMNEYIKDNDKLDEIIAYFERTWDYVLSNFIKAIEEQN